MLRGHLPFAARGGQVQCPSRTQLGIELVSKGPSNRWQDRVAIKAKIIVSWSPRLFAKSSPRILKSVLSLLFFHQTDHVAIRVANECDPQFVVRHLGRQQRAAFIGRSTSDDRAVRAGNVGNLEVQD